MAAPSEPALELPPHLRPGQEAPRPARAAGRVELLAPAGSFEALVAAVENGADAVYLGGQHFGARKFAQNFTDDELRRAIDHAHVRGVKVFVTVNTLVKNDEFPELLRFLRVCHDAGADAVIVQDLGVMRAVRELLPALPLHISTQATVHNTKGVLWLEALGAERVILAREMDLDEVKKVHDGTRTEVETFVHGALCYCYSGQCLASSLIGGRSGNRGACAYTCRLPFDMTGGGRGIANGPDPSRTEPEHVVSRHKHVLSSKDLQTIDRIPEMLAAGITSFKIEGRMKRPEYVAIATEVYRKAIDRYYAGDFHVTPDERARLLRVFNREFTEGFHWDDAPKWKFTNVESAGNRGTPLGHVVESGEGWVRVRLDGELRVGDGIEVVHTPDSWDREVRGRVLEGPRPSAAARTQHRLEHKRGAGKLEDIGPEEWGWTVRRLTLLKEGRPMDVGRALAGEVVEMRGHQLARPGDPVYKTADFEVLEAARRTYEGPPRRKVPVVVDVFVRPGAPLRVRMVEATRMVAIEHGSHERVQTARSAPVTADAVRAQLSKLGDTPFEARHVNVHLEPGAFVPIKALNEARRAAAAALEAAIARLSHRSAPADFETRAAAFMPAAAGPRPPTSPRLVVKCWGLENVHAALAGGARELYFSGLRMGGLRPKWDLDGLRAAADACAAAGARLWIDSGLVQHDWEVAMLAQAVDALRAHPAFAGVVAGHHGAIQVAKEAGVPFVADAGLNAFNSVTADALAQAGAARVVLSPELTLQDIPPIAAGTKTPVEALAHGRLALMTSEYCAIGHATDCQKQVRAPCHERPYAITDAKGYRFPLATDGACRMYMLNSRELNMIDRIPDLARAGVDTVRIETIGTTPDAVEVQVRTYLAALEAWARAPQEWRFDDAWWQALAQRCPDGFTTGHYDRGPL